jgi:integrase
MPMARSRGPPRAGACDLQWSQVELATGRLHVRRAKNGSPSVHPMQGDEIRALRRLQREQGPSSHVFMTERDGPMTPCLRGDP